MSFVHDENHLNKSSRMKRFKCPSINATLRQEHRFLERVRLLACEGNPVFQCAMRMVSIAQTSNHPSAIPVRDDFIQIWTAAFNGPTCLGFVPFLKAIVSSDSFEVV